MTETSYSDDIPSKDFIFLHSASPLLLFTYTLYPRIYNPFTLKDYLGLAMELINIFDIMEMITDLKYIHNYSSVWLAIYNIAVGMAMILISFPIEIGSEDLAWTKKTLEQDSKKELKSDTRKSNQILENVHVKINYGTINDNDTDDKTGFIEKPQSLTISNSSASYDEVDCYKYVRPEEDQTYNTKESKHKIVKVTCTMIFNNIMFAIIRLRIMITEQSVELGFTMIVKNFILVILHLCYLKRTLKIYRANRKPKDYCTCNQEKQAKKQATIVF